MASAVDGPGHRRGTFSTCWGRASPAGSRAVTAQSAAVAAETAPAAAGSTGPDRRSRIDGGRGDGDWAIGHAPIMPAARDAVPR